MTAPLSLDLRGRVVAAVTSSLSHRQAAERFSVSAASVSRWRTRQREEGTAAARPTGGDQRSHEVERHGALIVSLYEARRDITLQGLRGVLAEQGAVIGYGGLWRFFRRRRITLKKRPRTPPSRTAPTC